MGEGSRSAVSWQDELRAELDPARRLQATVERARERQQQVAASVVELPSDGEKCMHYLAAGTCSICNGRPPSLGPVTTCSSPSCREDIVWCYTENRRRMPVDAAPDPRGNVVRIGTRDGAPLVKVLGPQAVIELNERERQPDTEARPRYLAHFVTCPDAQRFQR